MSTQITTPIPGGTETNPNRDYAIWESLQSVGPAALTAKAGGGKSAATPLVGTHNDVTVVASGADSVLLPLAFPGAFVFVRNSAANAMQVFGRGTDTINGVATGTGVSHAATTSALYFCPVVTAAGVGKWYRILSA